MKKPMKLTKITRLCLIVVLLNFTFLLKAQENINASGAEITSNEGSVSYSIGQTFYNTNTGTNGSISEGVQQPYQISVTIGTERKNINLSAYPNPTTDYLTLEVNNFENTSFQLFNTSGKILQNKIITKNHIKIDMRNFITGLYFVRIIQNKQEIKIFKIIKK